jgi:hypothetical protein
MKSIPWLDLRTTLERQYISVQLLIYASHNHYLICIFGRHTIIIIIVVMDPLHFGKVAG